MTDTNNNGLGAYTKGQLEILNELDAIQKRHDLSDNQLCAKYLTLSPTTLSRLRAGKYAADVGDAFLKLDTNLRTYREEQALATKRGDNERFVKLAQQQMVLSSITACRLKPASNPDRLIVVLADTGGGKTATGTQIRVQFDGLYVEARESWRGNYYAALKDIGKAFGCDASDLDSGVHVAETALIDRAKKNRRVLAIDEGEYFGPRTINLVKLLLNQTETIVVILAIPELFARWQNKSWAESRQLNRRCHAVIDLGLVHPDDVALFLAENAVYAKLSNEDRKAIRGKIAAAANRDFRLKTVRAIEDALANEDSLTPETVEAAIASTRRMVARSA